MQTQVYSLKEETMCSWRTLNFKGMPAKTSNSSKHWNSFFVSYFFLPVSWLESRLFNRDPLTKIIQSASGFTGIINTSNTRSWNRYGTVPWLRQDQLSEPAVLWRYLAERTPEQILWLFGLSNINNEKIEKEGKEIKINIRRQCCGSVTFWYGVPLSNGSGCGPGRLIRIRIRSTTL